MFRARASLSLESCNSLLLNVWQFYYNLHFFWLLSSALITEVYYSGIHRPLLGLDLSHSKHGRNKEVEVAALWNVSYDHKVKTFCGSRSHPSVALFVQHLTDNVCIHDSGSSVCTMWTVRRQGVNFPVPLWYICLGTHSTFHLTKTNRLLLLPLRKICTSTLSSLYMVT